MRKNRQSFCLVGCVDAGKLAVLVVVEAAACRMGQPLYLCCEFSADSKDKETIQIVKEGHNAQQMTKQLLERVQSKRDTAEELQFWTEGPDGDIEVPLDDIVATVYSGTVAAQFPANYSEKTMKSGAPYTLLAFKVSWKDAKPEEKVSCGGQGPGSIRC